MPEKRSVYFSDHSIRLLIDTFSAEGNVSNKINANIDRYHEILMEAQRDLATRFTTEEMRLILAIVPRKWKRLSRASVIVADFPEIVRVALSNHGNGNEELITKISALKISHLLCLIEAIESTPAA